VAPRVESSRVVESASAFASRASSSMVVVVAPRSTYRPELLSNLGAGRAAATFPCATRPAKTAATILEGRIVAWEGLEESGQFEICPRCGNLKELFEYTSMKEKT